MAPIKWISVSQQHNSFIVYTFPSWDFHRFQIPRFRQSCRLPPHAMHSQTKKKRKRTRHRQRHWSAVQGAWSISIDPLPLLLRLCDFRKLRRTNTGPPRSAERVRGKRADSASSRTARRARLKVTYYVMTFTFNQTNVECPIYIHITRRYYYLTITNYYTLLYHYYTYYYSLIALLLYGVTITITTVTSIPLYLPPCVTIVSL